MRWRWHPARFQIFHGALAEPNAHVRIGIPGWGRGRRFSCAARCHRVCLILMSRHEVRWCIFTTTFCSWFEINFISDRCLFLNRQTNPSIPGFDFSKSTSDLCGESWSHQGVLLPWTAGVNIKQDFAKHRIHDSFTLYDDQHADN